MNFASLLINWYLSNKRDLPWRETTDPYIIWLSEIILQQTRVDQGLPYFQNFLKHYPDIHAFAAAEEQDLLKLWQGLGYYSRARNMHKAAKVVVSQYQGKFPKTYKELLTLPGVGPYTAAAIASFSYNLPHPVVDGNVFRVLARKYGIDTPINSHEAKKVFGSLAHEVMDTQRAGLYNQAIMEFGALHCKPQKPDCSHCIFNDTCIAFRKGRVQSLPKKNRKTAQRDRFFNYLHIINSNRTYLKQRTAKDIWQNLYELPNVETERVIDHNTLGRSNLIQELFPDNKLEILPLPIQLRHKLSHQTIHASFWKIYADTPILSDKSDIFEIENSDIEKYPIPRLLELYFNH